MMDNGMMNGSNMMMGWGGMFFGPFMMIGFFALIILAIVMIVKWASGNSSGYRSSSEALNILNERFAAGDIDAREYEERRRIIV